MQKCTGEASPADEHSVQNGILSTNASRFPLCIDPQQQAIKWIKKKWGDKLKIIQLSKPNYIADVEHCIENGIPLMIETSKTTSTPSSVSSWLHRDDERGRRRQR